MSTNTYYKVGLDRVILRFGASVDKTTLVNENFLLFNTDATPQEVNSPFNPIVVDRDYHVVTRELSLYWNVQLDTDTDYVLRIQNVKTAFGVTFDPFDISFDTHGVEIPVPDPKPPTKEASHVEDYSIKSTTDLIDVWEVIETEDQNALQIVSVTPDFSESYYLTGAANEGKISVRFNKFILANYINNVDFKLQKKYVGGTGIAVWETVNTFVSQASDQPVVNIYLPSQDATPVYSFQIDDASEHIFWQCGYKYKLLISKEISY